MTSYSPLVRSVLLSAFKRLLPVGVMMASLVGTMPGYALEFPDTGDRGAPSSTAGGGTRGGWCETEATWDDTSLFALVPKNNVSTFAADQATLWIQAAPMFHQSQAEIFIQNAETREVVYQARMTLDDIESGGIVKVNLPATKASGEPLLEPGQMYSWEFAVICSSGDRTQDYFINGLLEQVTISPALAAQLETADMETQAALYADAGIWQETLMLAEQLQSTLPNLLPELLQSVGLDMQTASL